MSIDGSPAGERSTVEDTSLPGPSSESLSETPASVSSSTSPAISVDHLLNMIKGVVETQVVATLELSLASVYPPRPPVQVPYCAIARGYPVSGMVIRNN